MNRPTMRRQPQWLLVLAFSAALAACGGGGGDMGSGDGGGADQASQTAAADSASATQAPQESAESTQAALQTMQGVVARGDAGATVACPGGGSARYQLAGGADDRALAAGEVYSVHFDECRGALGWVALSGDETVTITAAAPDRIDAGLAFDGLVSESPLSRQTLSGSATLSTGVAFANDGHLIDGTLTTHVTADRIDVKRHTALRDTDYTLSGVDIERTITVTGGVISATSVEGTSTVDASWRGGSYSATFETDGGVSFVAGVPVSGQWRVIGPRNTLDVSANATTITIGIDLGSNGTIDLTLTFKAGDWSGQAH